MGVRLADGGLYPALPPSEVDLEAGDRSLSRIAELQAIRLCLGHFGPVPDPSAEVALAREQLARCAEAVAAAGSRPDALAAELDRRLPLEPTVHGPQATGLLRWIGWPDANVDGLAGWAERLRARKEAPRQ
jgi:hypothetical protein